MHSIQWGLGAVQCLGAVGWRVAGCGGSCAPCSLAECQHDFSKLCPEPRVDASGLGVDESLGELVGLAYC